MDTLSLRLFLRVAELGSVSAAARDLVLSPASASARLAKLEELAGFRLFNRTTRSVSLTTDGAQYFPFVQQALEILETGLCTVKGRNAQAQGLLRITMPASFGRMHIIPILAKFQARHPLVQLDLRLSDEVLNVVEGAFDLIIRNASLEEGNMVARKLADDRRLLVSSPEYLQRKGAPVIPEELHNHSCVVLTGVNQWIFQSGQKVNLPRTHVVNDGEVSRMMVEDGLGIGVTSYWNGSESLRKGTLVEILPDFPLVTDSAIWALYPSVRMVAPKVRVMIDFLHDHFNPNPPWSNG